MQPLRLRKEGSGEITTSVGRVIDTTRLVSVKDTVLDPEIQSKGGWISLPFPVLNRFTLSHISEVYVPRFKSEVIGRMLILNESIGLANFIVRMLNDPVENAASQEMRVTKMVDAYLSSIARLMAGKSGIMGGHILSTRVNESGRAVLLVDGDHAPEYAGIPRRIMRGLGIKPGDLVLVGRDPTIWHGSVEIFIARTSDTACIHLHPIVFKQLASDCDGDQVYVYKIPQMEECQNEAKDEVLGFLRKWEQVEWPPYLKTQDGSEKVDLANVLEETKARAVTTGFSITPIDILENGPKMKQFCTRMGKDVGDENLRIIEGLSEKEVVQYLLDQNGTQLNMKMLLGPIGAASNRLKILAGNNKQLLREACLVSEWLQQKLLSSKHTAKDGKKEPYSIFDVLDLLNRRIKYRNASLDCILTEIGKMGMPVEKVKHIFTYLWITYPLSKAVAQMVSDLPEGTQRLLLGAIERDTFEINNLPKTIKRIMDTLMRAGKVTSERDIHSRYWDFAVGIVDLCKEYHPVFEMGGASPSSDIVRRVVVNKEVDKTGAARLCLAAALGDDSSAYSRTA